MPVGQPQAWNPASSALAFVGRWEQHIFQVADCIIAAWSHFNFQSYHFLFFSLSVINTGYTRPSVLYKSRPVAYKSSRWKKQSVFNSPSSTTPFPCLFFFCMWVGFLLWRSAAFLNWFELHSPVDLELEVPLFVLSTDCLRQITLAVPLTENFLPWCHPTETR